MEPVKKWIETVAAENGCPVACIKQKTITSQYQCNNFTPSYPGVVSSIHEIEEILVNEYVACWKMNQPLTVSEGLDFANSLITV